MVKLIEDYYPVVKFLKLERPENTKALGILDTVDKAFSDFGIPDYHKKVVGYCSDGADGVREGCDTTITGQTQCSLDFGSLVFGS